MKKIFENEHLKITLGDMEHLDYYNEIIEILGNKIDLMEYKDDYICILSDSMYEIADYYCPVYLNDIEEEFKKMSSYEIDIIVSNFGLEINGSFNDFMRDVIYYEIALDVEAEINYILENADFEYIY